MKRFDRALEDCLQRIVNGETLESCLRRYPQYAGELTPLLRTALELKEGANIRPTEAFKERSRDRLAAYMQSRPSGTRFQSQPRRTFSGKTKRERRRFAPAAQVTAP